MQTVSKSYLQGRYIAATKVATTGDAAYSSGRMTGVCMVAEKSGHYTGDDLSIRLQLLTDVLATKH